MGRIVQTVRGLSKGDVQVFAGVTSLFALLVYTWIHTGATLGHYIQPAAVGYVAAAGIELAVVSLSLRISDLRKSRQDPRFFYAVLVCVVVVSALANIAEGFRVQYGEPLTIESVQGLDIIQGAIGLTATGLISLIVLALAELIGQDVQAAARAAEREQRRAARVDTPAVQAEQTARTPEHIKAEILNILADQPDIALVQLAKRLDISRTTLYKYLDELGQAGRVHKNGNGVQVLEG